MKKLQSFLCVLLVLTIFTSCFEDLDDNAVASSSIKDFVWKGMNSVYLYKADVPNLDDNRFATGEEYTEYLNGFETPEDLFESLKHQPASIDRFSRIYSNYFDLQNLLQGTSLNNGLEFNLYYLPGSSTEIYGIITLVLNNSVASNLNIQRGQVFRAINGTNLNESNYRSLLSTNTYTLNFADYATNGTTDSSDDTVTLNGQDIELTKQSYTENPIHKTEVLNVSGKKIGYLMYNAFNASFNTELNNAFSTFSANGIDDLVIDLRYNGGGSVQTAAYLGSMVTGQFNGDVFSKLFFNSNLQSNNTEYKFTNTINGAAINSLNLSKVYVLTTNKRTASASELVINSLKSYIDVVVIGENTVGKTQASITVYDSPNLTYQNVNPTHTYAMQPLVANSTNANDNLVPSNGLTPDTILSEVVNDYGVLGDENEPLLAEAISQITGADRSSTPLGNASVLVQEKSFISAFEQDMYIDW